MKRSPKASIILTATFLLGLPLAWLSAQEQTPESVPGAQTPQVQSLGGAAPGDAASQDETSADTASAGNDTRKLINMPPHARDLMRQDMLLHMTALSQIFNALADGRKELAASIAETQIGFGAMGKHRGSAQGMGPGGYMPPEMRQLGWTMHRAASDLAKVIKEDNPKKTYNALQEVMTACMSCHYAYRTR